MKLPFSLFTFLLFTLAGCTMGPTVKVDRDGGVIATTGVSVETKTASEANTVTLTRKDGTRIELKSVVKGKDETSLSGGYFLEKTATNAADNARHSTEHLSDNGTKVDLQKGRPAVIEAKGKATSSVETARAAAKKTATGG